MHRFQKYSLYSFKEKFQVLKYSLGQRLVESTPEGLKSMHIMLSVILSKGITVGRKGEQLLIKHTINNCALEFLLRKNSSDVVVFCQVVVYKEYLPIIEILKKYNISLRHMIDAGANIGITSLFFKAYFPEASIVALEPFADNCEQLSANIKSNNLSDITILQQGLWGRTTNLQPNTSFRDGMEWAYRLIESNTEGHNSIAVTSVSDLLLKVKWDTIDFLKIDIEGGEVSVFAADVDISWLSRVKILALEIHDEFDCRQHIEDAIRAYGFEIAHSGELTICTNKVLLED